LVTYHPDTIYLRKLGCEERIYFSKPEGVREQNTCLVEYIAHKKYGAVSRNGSVSPFQSRNKHTPYIMRLL